jgi:hypothetical protein
MLFVAVGSHSWRKAPDQRRSLRSSAKECRHNHRSRRYARIGIVPSRLRRQIAEIPHIPSKHNHLRGGPPLVVGRVRARLTLAVGNEALRIADRGRRPPQRHVPVPDVQHDDAARGQANELKTDGHLGRCYLKGRDGDAANAILSAAGYNLRLVLAWLRALWPLILVALLQAFNDIARRNAL